MYRIPLVQENLELAKIRGPHDQVLNGVHMRHVCLIGTCMAYRCWLMLA